MMAMVIDLFSKQKYTVMNSDLVDVGGGGRTSVVVVINVDMMVINSYLAPMNSDIMPVMTDLVDGGSGGR